MYCNTAGTKAQSPERGLALALHAAF
jgi:hypothetical protein